MDKNSKPDERTILVKLDRLVQNAPEKYVSILRHFYDGMKEALVRSNQPLDLFYARFDTLLSLIQEQLVHPFVFEPYHVKIRAPFDYYQFGLNFIRQLVDMAHSSVMHLSIATRIEEQLRRGENVILLSNHQTETDPQAISILLEPTHPILSEKIIYVAGERVVTDPLAIPFSMGCDLLCIYSKRYIDHPIELKAEKQFHNKNTMEKMSRLLKEGGKAIYVAPSGGRDRKNAQGQVVVAPFDPQSIEMFYLMARKAKTLTHFYPLTLATYNLMPPPDTIQHELGETRVANYSPIHMSFSEEFDMESFPGSEETEKAARRKNRARAIWKIVNQEHQKLIKL